MYRLICACGQEMEIQESQAGCHVTCVCGEKSRVPGLSELKNHQERNEATPAVELAWFASTIETTDVTLSQPLFHLQHCCGRVGQDGNVSLLAMNNYLELMQWQVVKTIRSMETASFAELVLSIAIAPGDKKRIEFDLYPNDAIFEQQEMLREQIHEIEAPPIYASPIAFAIFIRMRPVDATQGSLSVFPSLSAAIKSYGLEAALREAFGMSLGAQAAKTSIEPKPRQIPWWRRLFIGRAPQQLICPSGTLCSRTVRGARAVGAAMRTDG